MANNIMNVLTVKGEPAAIKRFFDGIGGGTDEDGNPILIDFNKIIPCRRRLTLRTILSITSIWQFTP